VNCDILIVGGGTGGCAAAMAACSLGFRVILTEETVWIGGQLTAQGVPPDEHPWIEEFGCTRRYREFRNRVRQWYRDNRDLVETPSPLNPGGGWVSRLCCEPSVAHEVLRDMLGLAGGGSLEVLLRHKPVSATANNDRVEAVTLWNLDEDTEITISAKFVLDATELGDLLPLTGTDYVSGAESRADTGEPNAVDGPSQPDNVQGLTWCFAMSYRAPSLSDDRADGEGVGGWGEPPSDYAKWRSFKPDFWPGPLLGFEVLHAHTGEPRTLPLFRNDGDPYALFSYRQIVDPAIYREAASPPPQPLPHLARSIQTGEGLPVTLVNWPQNDYFEASIIDVDPPGSRSSFPGASGPVSEARLKDSIQLSLSLFHWLRTEAPRHDGGVGYPELGLWDAFPLGRDAQATGAFALYPYIRESRRIRAKFTVFEQHVAAYTNPGLDRAPGFADSIGIGAYRIDLHPSTSGANMIDTSTLPFQIPLGALIPVRMKNLLPACKNIGTTHITNGCYRLHPVEWNIGEVAGLLAGFCLQKAFEPSQVGESPGEFQGLVAEQGIELAWPDVPLRAL
jgi:hypothetical protein